MRKINGISTDRSNGAKGRTDGKRNHNKESNQIFNFNENEMAKDKEE